MEIVTLLATAAEGGEESSQTLFYVIGSALAAFGVLVGALGVMRHDFPGSKGARNAVLAAALLLVAAVMGTTIVTS